MKILTNFFKRKFSTSTQNISTILGEGCVIRGDIECKDHARIDGTIEGNVTATHGLVLGGKGILNGNVKTHEVVVYGIIKGNLDSKHLEIKSSGEIHGDVSTEKIQIHMGATCNGTLSMDIRNENLPQTYPTLDNDIVLS